MEAHKGKSVFIKHAKNIGRVYRDRAMELISICLIFSRVAPQSAHEDIELRRVLRACDLALHSAADSTQKATSKGNKLFERATRVVCSHFERWRRRCQYLSPGMAILPEEGSYTDAEEKWRPNMTIKFVLLHSPLAALHDPETIIVRQLLSVKPSFSEIMWNFSRYKDRARITLEQNPHFYSSLPVDESAYTPVFKLHPLGDLSLLKPHDTVYVLVDRPGRVFLETEREERRFGNVWMLNGTLIFKDFSGVLEGERLIRNTIIKGNLGRYDEPAVFPNCGRCTRANRSHLRPIITTPSVNPASGIPFDDWTVLSHPSSHSIYIQVYSAQRRRGYTKELDLPPPPPTSEEPEYHALYTSIKTLNDDVLLSIFKHYQPDANRSRKPRFGWFKLAHVCRRWRHLIYESAMHLDAYILCTEGAPVVDKLTLLPPLPLVVDYQSSTIRARDELGISYALRLRNRVRRVDLQVPPSRLRKLLGLMDEPFPILEHLSISSTANEDTSLILSEGFLAPNLRHLKLHGVNLSRNLPSLTSTVSLVTLTLENIRNSGHFIPKHLITPLRSFRQLEELSIGFSIPPPHSNAEDEFIDTSETPVVLPRLKRFTFHGASPHLESLVAHIGAPLLEQLSITLFYQVAFESPHLSHFINTIEGLKLPTAKITFEDDAVALVTDHGSLQLIDRPSGFSLRMCDVFDLQIDCAARICNALRPALSGVEQLTLLWTSEDWQDGEIGSAMWRKLLRPFIGVKRLHIRCPGEPQREVAHALELRDAGLDKGLLPGLQEFSPDISSIDSYPDARGPVHPFPLRESYAWLSELPQYTPPFLSNSWVLPDYFPRPNMFEHHFQHLWGMQDTPLVQPALLGRNLPAPYTPPVRVEHNPPRSARTARPVGIQPPPPKHIRRSLRPSRGGGGSSWR